MPENEGEANSWKMYWEPKVDEISIWAPHNWGGSYDPSKDITKKSEKVKSCGRVYTGNPYIRANGDISLCCFDYKHDLTVGNLVFEPLSEILQSNAYQSVKKMHDDLNLRAVNQYSKFQKDLIISIANHLLKLISAVVNRNILAKYFIKPFMKNK